MARFQLSGRTDHKRKSLAMLSQCSLQVSLARLQRGPLLPNWNWSLEVGTAIMQAQTRTSFEMPDIIESRAFGDALTFYSGDFRQVKVEAVTAPVKGLWYKPKSAQRERTLLYLHGGGYAYYSKSYENLIPLIALAANTRTFAVDYRLAPEHPFPAQLEDALAAYHWLLDSGVNPQQLVVAGDSAGGNLLLSLLLSLRDSALPLPALGLGLCPWTDLAASYASMRSNEKYDFVGFRMGERWSQWFCAGADLKNPRISPFYADLRGLCPLYIQAGSKEILFDMICAFCEKARAQGAKIRFEIFENMNHDFQAYGNLTTESARALKCIGEVVDEFLVYPPGNLFSPLREMPFSDWIE